MKMAIALRAIAYDRFAGCGFTVSGCTVYHGLLLYGLPMSTAYYRFTGYHFADYRFAGCRLLSMYGLSLHAHCTPKGAVWCSVGWQAMDGQILPYIAHGWLSRQLWLEIS